MSAHPLTDPIVWVQTLSGAALVLGLPGWWLLGRHVRASLPARLVLSMAAGFLAVAGAGLLGGHLGLPLLPWPWFALAAAAGFGLGRWPAYRATAADLLGEDGDLAPGQWLAVLAACLLTAAVLVALQADLPVPASRHDAGNHAFMTWRILETGHTSPDAIFAPPWGQPSRPYFTGWHAASALVAWWSRLPAWTATWLLPSLAAALLPASLALVWRRLGFAAPTAVLAAFLVPGAGDITAAIPGHGGLGQFVAMFALVLPVLALARALRSGRNGAAILAGLGLACLLLIHASWTVMAVILAALCVRRAGSRGWRTAGLALAAFLLVTVWDLVPAAGVYRERGLNPDDLLPLGECLRLVARSVGAWWGLEVVVVVALLTGLLGRATRPVAGFALFLGALSVALGAWQDPVSMVLSQPWYQVHTRFFPPLALLLAPLVATLTWRLAQVPGRRTPLVAVLLVALLATPAVWRLQGPAAAGDVYFLDDDARLARDLAEVVAEDAVVANWRNNGSCWAMHLSGRRFLMGANWILGEDEGFDHREAVKGLARGWWNPGVRALRDLGVTHLHATDHWPFERAPVLQRDALRRRPYLTPVLDGEHTTVFAIDWTKVSRRGGRR
ncbi:MAG: hypothetical protein GY838_08075 [bacterium]|nr:hypothetical protein [bacterium]